MNEQRIVCMQLTQESEVMEVVCEGDLEIRGVLCVGDCHNTFESGPVVCGGTIAGDSLNASVVHCMENFLVDTANLQELNVGGDVEGQYLLTECGAFVMGNINVELLVSQTHPVFCGGKFTGKFQGDPNMLHEHFADWGNVEKYM